MCPAGLREYHACVDFVRPLADLPDGGVEMTLLVSAPIEVRPWILGWGSACEVVAPEDLRLELAAEATGMVQRYQRVATARPRRIAASLPNAPIPRKAATRPPRHGRVTQSRIT